MESPLFRAGSFLSSPPGSIPISYSLSSPSAAFLPPHSGLYSGGMSDTTARYRDLLYPNLGLPQSPLCNPVSSTSASSHVQRPVPSHAALDSMPGSSFDRLRSNPMFHDLQMLLAHECSHLKVPASLITTSWNMSTLGALGRALPYSIPATTSSLGYGHPLPQPRSSTQEVYINHMQLQDEFIKLRLIHPEQTPLLMQVESYYSTEVGKLEMSRYQALASSLHHEQTKLALHAYYDKERVTLVKKINTMLSARLGTVSPRDKVDFGSETMTKLHVPDSTFVPSSTTQDISPGLSQNHRDGPSSEQKATSSTDSNISVNSSDFDDDMFVKPENVQKTSDISPTDFNSKFNVKCFGSLNQDILRSPTSESQLTSDKVMSFADSQRGRKRLFPDDESSSDINSQEKPRKRQRQLSSTATKVLVEWYDKNIHYPYPSDTTVQELSGACGLTVTQVKKWMANKRVRSYNTLSFSGNAHPIKFKFQNKKKNDSTLPDKENTSPTVSDEAESNVANNGICKPLKSKARKVLNDWYINHLYHPYPTDDEKLQLAMLGGITVSQVKSWFANKRSRSNNTRKQVPNYFIKKYPNYLPYIEMISQRRQSAKVKRENPSPAFSGHVMY